MLTVVYCAILQLFHLEEMWFETVHHDFKTLLSLQWGETNKTVLDFRILKLSESAFRFV